MFSALPKADEAVIPIEKFTCYVLDPIKSGGKWVLFNVALGYDLNNANMLVENIKQNIQNFPARPKDDKGFGMIYEVIMSLTGPNGKTANFLTAWIDDNKTGVMRLVTAYVTKRKGVGCD